MWVKLDDGFFDHPKAIAVGIEGRELALASWCWAARHLTDGQLPANLPPNLGLTVGLTPHQTPWIVKRLVDNGLWVPSATGNGWEIHDYLDFNPSKAWFDGQRESGRRGAERRWRDTNHDGEAHRQPQSRPYSRPVTSSNPPTPRPVDNANRNRPELQNTPPPPPVDITDTARATIAAIHDQLAARSRHPTNRRNP